MISNILYTGLIGSLIFTLIIIVVGTTGIFDAIRDKEGKFKKELNWQSVLGFSLMLGFIIGLFYWSNWRFVNMVGEIPSLMTLWANAFGTFMVLHLFDLLILDYLIIVKWHPDFLNLPDTDYYTKFKPHLEGFFRGLPLGLVLSFLVSTLFFCAY